MAQQIYGSRHWVLARKYIPSCDRLDDDGERATSEVVLAIRDDGSFVLASVTERMDSDGFGTGVVDWEAYPPTDHYLYDIAWWQSLPDAPDGGQL